jgi:hypothetical protein
MRAILHQMRRHPGGATDASQGLSCQPRSPPIHRRLFLQNAMSIFTQIHPQLSGKKTKYDTEEI